MISITVYSDFFVLPVASFRPWIRPREFGAAYSGDSLFPNGQ